MLCTHNHAPSFSYTTTLEHTVNDTRALATVDVESCTYVSSAFHYQVNRIYLVLGLCLVSYFHRLLLRTLYRTQSWTIHHLSLVLKSLLNLILLQTLPLTSAYTAPAIR
jgi:hypothetical protein